MNLQDLAEALRCCTGGDCASCRNAREKGGRCCISGTEINVLKLTAMMPITKDMITLGREWISEFIARALRESCENAAEDFRKALCLPTAADKAGTDVRPVVHCRDCRFDGLLQCPLVHIEHQQMVFINHDPDWFCADGRQKMTEREIVQALRWCAQRDCSGCPNGPGKAGCIYELKMAAADAIEKLLHEVFVAENKDKLCRYNSVIICDWPEERPGRCRSCPCNQEKRERIEWECEA